MPAKAVRQRLPALERLALRELEAGAGAALAVFLALLGASVTSHQTLGLEGLAKLGVELYQGAGDAELDGVRLAHHAAATNRGDDVEGLADVVDTERTLRRGALLRGHEVNVNVLLVDGEFAVAGAQKNPRDRRFAAAGSIILNEICHDTP